MLKLIKTETVKQLFIGLGILTLLYILGYLGLYILQCIMHVKTNESQFLCHTLTQTFNTRINILLNITQQFKKNKPIL